jgi:hypothetical protein
MLVGILVRYENVSVWTQFDEEQGGIVERRINGNGTGRCSGTDDGKDALRKPAFSQSSSSEKQVVVGCHNVLVLAVGDLIPSSPNSHPCSGRCVDHASPRAVSMYMVTDRSRSQICFCHQPQKRSVGGCKSDVACRGFPLSQNALPRRARMLECLSFL